MMYTIFKYVSTTVRNVITLQGGAIPFLSLTRIQWRTEGEGGFNPPTPRNSEVLTKLSRIPSSVENTSVTT
jgi:hypothetical protein